jgi:ubiquinone/menaquinone biosynthesis C-methylase UbiE
VSGVERVGSSLPDCAPCDCEAPDCEAPDCEAPECEAPDCKLPDCEAGVLSSPEPFVAGVRDGYERWAPTYDHFPNPLLAREQRYVLPLLPGLRNRGALDLACGTGRWLTRLSAVGARPAVGVDLSSAMLRVAGDKEELSGTVVQGNCLSLPFGPSTFDFSICSFALGHVQDLRSAAAELSRVMKPGSDLFITDLHPEGYARGWRTGFRDRQSAVQVHTLSHSAEDILWAFNSAGCGCVTHVGLCLGEPERPIFVEAGRQHLFQAACRVLAVLFCHFKRISPSAVYRRMR